jgi:hypothetical protein
MLDQYLTVSDVKGAIRAKNYLAAYRFCVSNLETAARVGTVRLYDKASAAPIVAAHLARKRAAR